MNFHAGDMIRFGWEAFKKRPWFLIGALVITTIVSYLVGFVSGLFGNEGLESIAGFVINVAASILISMGTTALLLKAHDSVESVSYRELWHPQPFWSYLGVTIIFALATVVGFILLIIPGIIVFLAYQFGEYIVIDRNLGPVEALEESARITKGNRWELLWLFLMIIGINILGALALLVGLLVTVPVSWLAIVHAYRTLEHRASEVAAV